MPVPNQNPAPHRAHLLCVLLLVLILPLTLFAKGPQPAARIPLEPLGLQPLSQRFLLAGSSMVTVHYVDQTHILLTFVARRLIPRIPGDPPSDQDRNVDALLLELPSGRVLARAEWFLHDHGQYLWSLGHGQFLLRSRNTFTTFAPLAHLAKKQSFQQQPFLTTDRRVVLASLSADAGLLTIETADPLPDPDPDAEASVASRAPITAGIYPSPKPRAPEPVSAIQYNFFRLVPLRSSPDEPIVPIDAGKAISRRPSELPLSSAGLLHALDQGHQRWVFNFRQHDGTISKLALVDSTCRPSVNFISASEFIALACHGGDIRQMLAGYNLRGDAMWVQSLPGPFISPYLALAPAAGRFAFGRVLANSFAGSNANPDASLLMGQSVDVIQDDSGKTLLHLDCTPIVRAGQNFALAPDGMGLAILHDTTLEIYLLPPLGKEDRNAIELAEKSAPPSTNGVVDVGEFPSPEPAAPNARSQSPRPSSSPPETSGPQLPNQQPAEAARPLDPSFSSAPAAAVPEAAPAPTSTELANPSPPDPVRRRPPTLYNPDAPSPGAPPQSSAPPTPEP